MHGRLTARRALIPLIVALVAASGCQMPLAPTGNGQEGQIGRNGGPARGLTRTLSLRTPDGKEFPSIFIQVGGQTFKVTNGTVAIPEALLSGAGAQGRITILAPGFAPMTLTVNGDLSSAVLTPLTQAGAPVNLTYSGGQVFSDNGRITLGIPQGLLSKDSTRVAIGTYVPPLDASAQAAFSSEVAQLFKSRNMTETSAAGCESPFPCPPIIQSLGLSIAVDGPIAGGTLTVSYDLGRMLNGWDGVSTPLPWETNPAGWTATQIADALSAARILKTFGNLDASGDPGWRTSLKTEYGIELVGKTLSFPVKLGDAPQIDGYTRVEVKGLSVLGAQLQVTVLSAVSDSLPNSATPVGMLNPNLGQNVFDPVVVEMPEYASLFEPGTAIVSRDGTVYRPGNQVGTNVNGVLVDAAGNPLLDANGVPLVGNNSGQLVGNNSGQLVGNNSGQLVGNNSGTLVGSNGAALGGTGASGATIGSGVGVYNFGGAGALTTGSTATGTAPMGTIALRTVDLLSENPANLVSNNAGSLIANNSGGLIANNSGGLIANNSGGLVSNNAGSLISQNTSNLTGFPYVPFRPAGAKYVALAFNIPQAPMEKSTPGGVIEYLWPGQIRARAVSASGQPLSLWDTVDGTGMFSIEVSDRTPRVFFIEAETIEEVPVKVYSQTFAPGRDRRMVPVDSGTSLLATSTLHLYNYIPPEDSRLRGLADGLGDSLKDVAGQAAALPTPPPPTPRPTATPTPGNNSTPVPTTSATPTIAPSATPTRTPAPTPTENPAVTARREALLAEKKALAATLDAVSGRLIELETGYLGFNPFEFENDRQRVAPVLDQATAQANARAGVYLRNVYNPLYQYTTSGRLAPKSLVPINPDSPAVIFVQ